jgi:hypothetical protein
MFVGIINTLVHPEFSGGSLYSEMIGKIHVSENVCFPNRDG